MTYKTLGHRCLARSHLYRKIYHNRTSQVELEEKPVFSDESQRSTPISATRSNMTDATMSSECHQAGQMPASQDARHIHQRDAPEHYLCAHSACQANLFTRASLLEHYAVDHSNVFCTFCNTLRFSSLALEAHMAHNHSFCRKCKIGFKDDRERRRHYRTTEQHRHSYCSICGLDIEGLLSHMNSHFKPKEGYHHHAIPKVGRQPKALSDGPPNHYRTLGIHPSSQHEEILKAAKSKRIETYPDRFTKDGPSSERLIEVAETAKNVGWAANVLCDPSERQKYDAEMWSSRYWRYLATP